MWSSCDQHVTVMWSSCDQHVTMYICFIAVCTTSDRYGTFLQQQGMAQVKQESCCTSLGVVMCGVQCSFPHSYVHAYSIFPALYACTISTHVIAVVRVWNSSWSLVSTFVGHLAAVTSLSTYPTGPYVMSSSEDCTIRVWNLETMDEMERQGSMVIWWMGGA